MNHLGYGIMQVDRDKIIQGDTAQFDLVLATHFLEQIDKPASRMDAEQRLTLAHTLARLNQNASSWQTGQADQLIAHLEETAGLLFKPIEQAEFKFNYLLLDNFISLNELEDRAASLLAECRTALLVMALAYRQFWLSSHPLTQLIDYLYAHLVGFSRHLSKTLTPLFDHLQSVIEKIKSLNFQDTAGFEKLLIDTQKLSQQFLQRFQKTSARVEAQEAGQLKIKQARYLVNEFLSEITLGQFLPEALVDWLKTVVANELSITISTEGEQSPKWLQQKKLLRTLVALYQPNCKEKNHNLLWGSFAIELSEVLLANSGNSELKKGIEMIEYDFYCLLQNQSLNHLQQITIVDDQQKLALNQNKHQYCQFKSGQWFRYTSKAGEERVYLSLALLDYGQYLLMNYLGQKVVILSAEDFSRLITTQKLMAINTERFCAQRYAKAVDFLLATFYERYERKQASKLEKAQELIKTGRETMLVKANTNATMAEEKARIKAIASAKAQAQKEKIVRTQLNTIEESLLEAVPDHLAKQIRLTLDSLSLGAQIDFFAQPEQPAVRAKLAVKLAATKRFIFIDHDGLTILDTHRKELIDMVIKGSVQLIDMDAKFHRSLQQVIQDIQTPSSKTI